MQGLIKWTMNNCLLLHGQLIISQPHNLLHFLRPTGQNSTGFSRNLVDVVSAQYRSSGPGNCPFLSDMSNSECEAFANCTRMPAPKALMGPGAPLVS